jgi:hypothetical protein
MKLPFETFNLNEWCITFGIIATYWIVWKLPPRLNSETTLILFLWGFSVAKFYDFTIGGGLFDYYDVNDSSHYEIFDEISYFLYAPFSYFFIYLFEVLHIKGKMIGLYILGWSLFSLLMEWISVSVPIITYQKGYTIGVSFVIYWFTQSITLLFYRWIERVRSTNR